MKQVILVKYGEIALRKSNRRLFENQLIDAMYRHIGRDTGFVVRKEQGRLLIEREDGDVDPDLIMPKIKNVLGIVAFCPCVKTDDQTIDNLRVVAVRYMRERFREEPFTFKVETKRSDKSYPLSSYEVSADLGEQILNAMPGATVNVRQPQVVLNVELRNNAYVFTEAVKGLGGLPAGTSGKGMLMLSGGIDSPVAGFLMAKRGVALEAVYFHSPPFTSERAEEKARDLAERLAVYTGHVRLYVARFTDIQTYLYEHAPISRLTLLLKRAMMRAADELGRKNGCQCLITGDSVGQVASQTLHALQAVDSASTLPVMRPLAGFDKLEITRLAESIETFGISVRPYEDCCTLFVAKHPELKPRAYVIEGLERRMERLPEMIREAVETAVVYDY